MKAKAAISLAILSPMLLFVRAGEPIRIGILGDQTGVVDNDLEAAYSVLRLGVSALNEREPDAVIHVGDLVESALSANRIREDFGRATSILDQLEAPWYLTAGDHDVNPPRYRQNSQDRSREELFRKLYSAINPNVSEHLYYGFDVGGYHFIALYSLERLHTDPRWGNVFFNEIGDEQLAWLKADLEANKGKDGIIVFLHQPMWYNWSGWSRVHELLAGYAVRAVIAGHYHYNQRDSSIDGIQYWVVGATGGTTKSGKPNSGDLQHVTVLRISGDSLDFTMIPLAPFSQRQWTPRYEMDRLQAVHQVLGSLVDFASESPVFIKEGRLVQACDSDEAARLVLRGLGNAAQFPSTISIEVAAAPSIEVSRGTFADGVCQGDVSDFGCLLRPSALVPISNTSQARVRFPGAPPPPALWTGTLAVQGSPPEAGTEIKVRVALSFRSNGRSYLLDKDLSTRVRGCSKAR